MMLKKIFLLLVLQFSLQSFFAQKKTSHPMVYAGYLYQNQSFGEVGVRYVFLSNDDYLYRLGGGAVMGAVHDEFAIMPKLEADFLINTEKNVDFNHSYYFLLGTEVTTKYVAPKAGFSLFGILDLTAGYAFPYDNATLNGKKLQGFSFNFALNIPLVVFDK